MGSRVIPSSKDESWLSCAYLVHLHSWNSRSYDKACCDSVILKLGGESLPPLGCSWPGGVLGTFCAPPSPPASLSLPLPQACCAATSNSQGHPSGREQRCCPLLMRHRVPEGHRKGLPDTCAVPAHSQFTDEKTQGLRNQALSLHGRGGVCLSL